MHPEHVELPVLLARVAGGAGLGLTIAAAVATAYGGAAGLDPNPGGGARAWLRVPRRAPASP